jgi:hypothetical protein
MRLKFQKKKEANMQMKSIKSRENPLVCSDMIRGIFSQKQAMKVNDRRLLLAAGTDHYSGIYKIGHIRIYSQGTVRYSESVR